MKRLAYAYAGSALLLTALWWLVAAPLANAQTTTPTTTPTTTTTTTTSAATTAAATTTVSPTSARLGQRITITTTRLTEVLQDLADNKCERLVLYLDGLPLKGMHAISCEPETGEVTFILHRPDESQKNWRELMGSPSTTSVYVRLGLGDADGRLRELDADLELEIVPLSRLLAFLLLWLVFTGLVIRLAWTTDLLREGPALDDGRKRPYSLARFQMALWLYLIAVAYVFIWAILGEVDSINASIVALTGLSSGTALGSGLLDARKQEQAAEQDSNDDERVTTGKFLDDVLYENGALSLHRLQMFVWTLILAIVFCYDVYYQLNMPEFDSMLLTFMGVSMTTFLAFKGPENATGAAATAASGDDPPAGDKAPASKKDAGDS